MAVLTNPIATGWLNENSLREFPFHEGCGLRPSDSAGALVENGWSLPNCLVVDMSISVYGSNFDPFLYLGHMSVVDRGVTLVFCDRSGDRVMSLYASAESHVKNESYQISGTGSFLDARGVICLGDLDEFFDLTPDGAYEFSAEEARVEPTCIKPAVVGVKCLRSIDSAGYTSRELVGDVNLVAGENIRFNFDPDTNSLWISADSNAGYTEQCDCQDVGLKYVRSINGVAVENVNIVGDGRCLSASASDGIVSMSDTCSAPCCGCAETTFINQTVNDLQTSVNTLMGNVESLGTRLTEFITSYVLSRKTLK